MQLPKSRLETLRFTLPLRKRKKSRMPFILNALKKKFVHCFPAGNCSIIKYIRIPAGLQSDNWKRTWLVFLFSIQFTPKSDKKKRRKIALLFYVRPSLPPMPQSWKLLQEKMKTNLQHLMVSKHGQRANRGKKWVKLITCSSVNFNLRTAA